MATFKQIRGQTIKKYTTNPTNPLEGQMWYNNTTGTLKVYRNVGGAWAAGPSISDGPATQRQAISPQTANTSAILCGGSGPGVTPPAWGTDVEDWNGTAWSEGTVMGTGRRAFGSSSQTDTAAVVFGGNPTMATTEEWNGTSWTATGSLASARQYIAGFGSQTSAVGCGGYIPAQGAKTLVEEYNGATWTTGTVLPTAEYGGHGLGASGTAGFLLYPAAASPTNITKQYDGTSWTDAGGLNTIRDAPGLSGINTAAIAFGGVSPAPASTTVTEEYDGSAWATTSANLATATAANASGFGSSTSAIRAAGGVGLATEEYTNPTIATQTVTTS